MLRMRRKLLRKHSKLGTTGADDSPGHNLGRDRRQQYTVAVMTESET